MNPVICGLGSFASRTGFAASFRCTLKPTTLTRCSPRVGRSLWIGDAADRPTEERLTVERARPFKDGVLLKAVEHSTRDEAVEKLRGAVLLIPEAEAAPLKEDEIFYHRLIGMRVVGPEGEVGKVERVWELAAGDLLEVRRPDGSELLVPFVQAVVRKVDPEADTLEIDPPPGLLEL